MVFVIKKNNMCQNSYLREDKTPKHEKPSEIDQE